jgi:hypothetical protein
MPQVRSGVRSNSSQGCQRQEKFANIHRMTVEEYLSRIIAAQLTHELEPILKMKEVTRNTDLLGSYTEAVVRRLSTRVVHRPIGIRANAGTVRDQFAGVRVTRSSGKPRNFEPD